MDNASPIVALVDDDKIFQLTATKTLMSLEARPVVLQFANGEEALQFLRSKKQTAAELPDYIFLDINMPFVDGWMFLEDFDNLKPDLAKPMIIYMVSSSIDPRDMTRATDNRHVSKYVIKPVSREKFRELLHVGNLT